MKFNAWHVGVAAAVMVAFVAVGKAPPEPQADTSASGARWACGEFIARKVGDVALSDRLDWRVKAPQGDESTWVVEAEFVRTHAGGISTRHRTTCTMEDRGGDWRLVGLR